MGGDRFIIFLSLFVVVNSITCLNEQGKPVDWWVILKLPEGSSQTNPNAAGGYGYAYADSTNLTLNMSDQTLDTNLQGALASTFDIINSADSSEVGWLIYNDEPPTGEGDDSYAHMKGFLAFNNDTGYWLVHSVPKFPVSSSQSYSYPDSGKYFGQSFICISISTTTVETIGALLMVDKPTVYDYNLPNGMQHNMPNIVSILNKQFVEAPQGTSQSIFSMGGTNFTVFAKNAAWASDLYEYLIQPAFNTDMYIETWMNGEAADKMPSFCTPKYRYESMNIYSLQMGSEISWIETKDHSKWAMSVNNEMYIVCIGDINRQYSQAKRGGGSVCVQNGQLWNSFKSIVTQIEPCQN